MNREDDPTFEFDDEPANQESSILLPWEQQEKKPVISDLLQTSYHSSQRMTTLAKSTHRHISSLKQVRGSVRWQGHEWKWAITYSHPEIDPHSPASFAYLIPNPAQLQLVIPINKTMHKALHETDQLNNREYLKDAIANAIIPNQYAWPNWTITNKKHSTQLIRLIKWKLDFLTNHHK